MTVTMISYKTKKIRYNTGIPNRLKSNLFYKKWFTLEPKLSYVNAN